MDDRTLLKTGIIGLALAILCCATPVLVMLLATLGLSAQAGGLDFVLISAFVMFVGVTIYALHRRRKEATCCEVPPAQTHKET